MLRLERNLSGQRQENGTRKEIKKSDILHGLNYKMYQLTPRWLMDTYKFISMINWFKFILFYFIKKST